ncbi:MAG: type I methionyl aminopeptidase [Caldicoprobacterales bacterium]|jgi:methionyl aminopeptidase|nr:type I methionyl aminopeptidase [Clostridiales bacterium]
MIVLKSRKELEIMREAGRITAGALRAVEEQVRPGVTTRHLDKLAEEYILLHNATPAFKGYNGFPASICASVNAQVVHGIPNDKPLEEGDIISIDIGAFYKGYCADAARTFPVGNISSEAAELIDAAKESFYESLKYSRLGYRISDISHAIQSYVESRGFSVVKSFVGHGIGQRMHEDPQVPNFGLPGMGPRLRPGMTLAVEPMVNQGTDEVEILEDGWTVLTKDRLLSAHYENTIAITEEDPLILTLEERE